MTVRWRCGDPGDKSCDTATNRTNGMWCGVYNLRRVNISHFKAVDSRRFCYFYIFTNFPIPAGKCREMVSNPEASRKPRKSLSRSPLLRWGLISEEIPGTECRDCMGVPKGLAKVEPFKKGKHLLVGHVPGHDQRARETSKSRF